MSLKFIPKLIWLSIFIGIFSLQSCKKKILYVQLQGNAQGTTYNIKYKSDSGKIFQKEIDSIFTMIDNSMSTYLDSSLISKINSGDSLVIVDEHFYKVFDKSRQIFLESDGLFDPTIGGLIKAYGFGKDKEIHEMNQKKLDSLMQWVGFDKVSIQEYKIKKENPNIKLDFNAIAQGYTVDVIVDFLKSQNISNAMVELGGEVRVIGLNPENKPWTIGVQNPESSEVGQLETTISLNNEALATSGNYRKFKIDAQGNKFVHIVNPKNGKAQESNLLSATVIHPNYCALADAYATTFMVMGLEESLKFLEKHTELKVFLIYTDQQGNTKIYSTIK